jgi:glycosyltransferase involved in cell wall biosynthesis
MKYIDIYDGLSSISGVPIIIPTFNNPTYLKNTVDYFLSKKYDNIVVLDNNSSYPPMIELLERFSKNFIVIMQNINAGPRQLMNDPKAFEILPEYFFITDPDLKFNDDMPDNFLEVFKKILDSHNVFKVASALSLDIDAENVLDDDYVVFGTHMTIRQLEQRYYETQVIDYHSSPGYIADTDTTFALYKKSNSRFGLFRAIRMGGIFSAVHYGWYRNPPIPALEYEYYKSVLAEDFSSTEVLKRDGKIW